MAMTTANLSWVDTWIKNVRPYVFVRREDNLLIKRPNQAQKLNSQGALLLNELLDGKPIREILQKLDHDKIRDVGLFLFDVKRWLEGSLDEMNRTSATDHQPCW
jgi:hypothetical protein